MAIRSFQSCSLLATLVLLSGCGQGVRIIGPDGEPYARSVVEVGVYEIDYAVEQLVTSLVDSGAIERKNGQPALLRVQVFNDTSTSFNVEELTMGIRSQLTKMKLGRVLTGRATASVGAESELVRDEMLEENFVSGETELRPDYLLTGRITQMSTRDTRNKRKIQKTHTFRLTVSTNRGVEVWTEQVRFTEGATAPKIG